MQVGACASLLALLIKIAWDGEASARGTYAGFLPVAACPILSKLHTRSAIDTVYVGMLT